MNDETETETEIEIEYPPAEEVRRLGQPEEALPLHPDSVRVECPRCGELRAASGLSRKVLAEQAVVAPRVIFDLEHGWQASRAQARALLQALGQAGVAVGDEGDELVPHRFLPNCKTLRQKVKLRQNRLAVLAGVDAELIEDLEKGRSGRQTQVEAVFQVLRQHHRDRLRKDLGKGEMHLLPPDLPQPRLGYLQRRPTDPVSRNVLPSPMQPVAGASIEPSVRAPEPGQSEHDLSPPEFLSEAAPVVPEAGLAPHSEEGHRMPSPAAVPTPDAGAGTDEPDVSNRIDVQATDESAAADAELAAGGTAAAAADVLEPESRGAP